MPSQVTPSATASASDAAPAAAAAVEAIDLTVPSASASWLCSGMGMLRTKGVSLLS